ncbi:MAG: MBL fold metallo-hydrolase [Bacteroidales bacterium]|jgi:glyoxylase-like metal-dependent hydrolase (beta-lactamase superfamily II)|nr:MBL fold metallo-hydrolase [Bacteroidales bacterium]HPB01589.1 MBL fold metallo-hydrolase [Bacteroidales bacterium]
MKIIPIITEVWKIDAGVAFGVIPRSIWSRFYPVGEDNLIPLSNRCLLVETSNRLVLIETGFGNKRDEKYYQYKYISERTSLAQAIQNAGYKPGSVTDVIFTHLHDDHCGGAVNRSQSGESEIVCPNAKHWVSKKQWESAMKPNKREAAAYFAENMLPLHEKGLMCFVEKEEEIIPGISVLLRDGHTSGQMLPLINTPARKWLYAADFIPSISHISPVWVASVDVMPILALEEKEIFLHKATEENIGLIFEHDYHHEAATVVKNIKGFEGVPEKIT